MFTKILRQGYNQYNFLIGTSRFYGYSFISSKNLFKEDCKHVTSEEEIFFFLWLNFSVSFLFNLYWLQQLPVKRVAGGSDYMRDLHCSLLLNQIHIKNRRYDTFVLLRFGMKHNALRDKSKR